MTLQYNEKFENECEKKWMQFIGYISPEGKVLDFRLPFGAGGHNRNRITDIFVQFLYYELKSDNYRLVNGTYLKGKDYEKAFKELSLSELSKLQSEYNIKRTSDYQYTKELLKKRIQDFFLNLYQGKDFFTSFGQKIILLDFDEFVSNYYDGFIDALESDKGKKRYIRTQYNTYWREEILSYFKDMMVQYLGYDAVERCIPRTITTSCLNVNERFYNFKLMDFNIVTVPQMVWNEEQKMYIPYTRGYETEKEEMLEQEITSIKRLVKRDERYKFFKS